MPDHIKDLIPDAKNRRAHNPRNIGMVVEALHAVGAARSIVIDEDDVILAGNGVTEAAAEAGITKLRVIEAAGDEIIAVRRSGLSAEQKRALAIYDNRAGELATWNIEQLREDLKAGLDLKAFFFPEELQALTANKQGRAGLTDPDEIPAERTTDILAGDLFELGRHTLLCGDSTSQSTLARLMGGLRAGICVTSPPYNAGSNTLSGNRSKSDKSTRYLRDDAKSQDEWLAFLSVATTNALTFADVVVMNLQMLAGNKIALCGWLSAFRENLIDIAIWVKDVSVPAMAERVLNSDFEFLVGLTNRPEPSRAFPGATFCGTISNVHRGGSAAAENTDNASGLLAATFPTHLVRYALNFGLPDGLVLDVFGGTGTTMIVCEEVTRPCRLVEIEPVYCQVIIDRWEAFTGQKAVKVGEAVRA